MQNHDRVSKGIADPRTIADIASVSEAIPWHQFPFLRNRGASQILFQDILREVRLLEDGS